MARVVTIAGPRQVHVEDAPDAPLGSGEVRVETLYSGISAGTELASYRGSNPYLSKRWDAQRRLFLEGEAASLAYPLQGIGYEEVGRVVEVAAGVERPRVGDLVYGTWGHRSHHVMAAPDAAARVLPAGLDPRLGVFSHIGAVALNGVHDASLAIGETVAVFGLGVPGQIVAQLCARSGARVIGVDPLERRRALATELAGLEVALDPADGAPAEAIKALTGDRGADVAIEVSGNGAALHEAIRSVAYGSTVVAMGFVQGEARGLWLGDEFHHNRVSVRSSQISGVAAERSYRWDKPRLARTALALAADGTLDLAALVSHVFDVEAAADAYRLVDETPADALQVLLSFQAAAA